MNQCVNVFFQCVHNGDNVLLGGKQTFRFGHHFLQPGVVVRMAGEHAVVALRLARVDGEHVPVQRAPAGERHLGHLLDLFVGEAAQAAAREAQIQADAESAWLKAQAEADAKAQAEADAATNISEAYDVQIQEYKEKLQQIEAMFLPFLEKLRDTGDKEYIYWPNRKDAINKQIDKLLKLTRG